MLHDGIDSIKKMVVNTSEPNKSPCAAQVYERLDRGEAKKRVAAAVASGLLPEDPLRPNSRRRVAGAGTGGGAGASIVPPQHNLSALQRVVAAWEAEEEVGGQYLLHGSS